MLRVATTILTGLLAGALCLEGVVLVPYWRTLESAAFAELHLGFAPRLCRFFAPLTTAAVSISVASGVAVFWEPNRNRADWFAAVSTLLAASLLAFYRLYFHAANKRLPGLAGAGDDVALAVELRRWQRTHRIRTGVSVAAFVLSTLSVAS